MEIVAAKAVGEFQANQANTLSLRWEIVIILPVPLSRNRMPEKLPEVPCSLSTPWSTLAVNVKGVEGWDFTKHRKLWGDEFCPSMVMPPQVSSDTEEVP